jgi:hypothetical protein
MKYHKKVKLKAYRRFGELPWILRRLALVRTEVSEERCSFIIRVTRKSKLGTTLAVTSYAAKEILCITRATRRNIPEDGILHSHCCENLKSYKDIEVFTTVTMMNAVF